MTSTQSRIAVLALLASVSTASATVLQDATNYLKRGDHAAALELLDRAPGAEKSVRSRLLRSAALAGSGRVDEAIAILERLIDEYPDRPEPYNNLAALYAGRGDVEKAKAVLEQALQTNPSYATVYENLSTVYVEMARRSYAKALHTVKDAGTPQLALLYEIQGDVTQEAPAVVTVAASEPKPKANLAAEEKRPEATVAAAETPPPMQNPAPAPVAAAKGAPATDRVEPVPAAAASVPEKAPAPAPAVAPVAEAAGEVETVTEEGAENRRKQAVIAVLKRWADAWSAQDVEGYLAAYGPDFQPGDGMSRERWESVRRIRLKKPKWIKVSLSDFKIRAEADDSVVVELMQEYRSNTYRDRSLKRFVLVERDGLWRIRSEEDLKIFR